MEKSIRMYHTYAQAHTYARSHMRTDVHACSGQDMDVSPVPLCHMHARYIYGGIWRLHIFKYKF